MATAQDVIDDIKANPHNHAHSYTGVVVCSTIDGVCDIRVIEAHEDTAPYGYNGGTACDVSSGPCSCGAWHH